MFDIKEFKKQIDLTDYLSRYLSIKKNKASCPFHKDSNPSFVIYPETQSYHCFGCKATGDVINFAMTYHNMNFIDAVNHLSETYGLSSPFVLTFEQRLHKMQTEFLRGQEVAIDWCSKSRGIPKEVVIKHQIGCTEGRLSYLIDDIKALNMNINALNNRISIPIFHESGKLVGFTFRSMDKREKIKYLHLKKMPKNYLFYNEHSVKDFKEGSDLFIVEGFFDVLRLDSIGINAIAVMGSNISDKQVKKLKNWIDQKRFNLCLMMDGDEAGQKASKDISLTLLKEGIRHKVYYLPDKKDPDEYFQKQHFDINALNTEDMVLSVCNKDEAEEVSRSIKDAILIFLATDLARIAKNNDERNGKKRKQRSMLDTAAYEIFKDDKEFIECYEFLNNNKTEINSLNAYLTLQEIFEQAHKLLDENKKHDLKILYNEVIMFCMTTLIQNRLKSITKKLSQSQIPQIL